MSVLKNSRKDGLVLFYGIDFFVKLRKLICEGHLKKLSADKISAIVKNFTKILKEKYLLQCEYKIIHEIRKEVIRQLKNRSDHNFQNEMKTLERLHKICFLAGRHSILTTIIQKNKIDIYAPSRFVNLIPLADYKKLDFFDLEDLTNLGDAYAKKLLKKDIIESVLYYPAQNANTLIQCGYFDYL